MPRSNLAFPTLLLGLTLSTTAYADGRETVRDPACDLFMGDVDGSGTVDELDRDAITDWLFNDGEMIEEVADVNGDGRISMADAIFLSAYLYSGGTPPRTDVLAGDANGSGTLDWADFIAVADHLTGNYPDVCRTGADANRDSRIDVADLMVVFEMVDGTCGMGD